MGDQGPLENDLHINVLELTAAALAVQTFAKNS